MNVEIETFLKEEVKNGLKVGVATVTFLKKDGTSRVMRCTLKSQYLPEQETGKRVRALNDDVLAVWDLDNGGWRSFRIDSIQNIVYSIS